MIEFGITRRLRRHNRVDDVNVVVAQMMIVTNKIVGMGARRRQCVGFDRHAGDEGRDVIGRASEHAEGGVGDPAVPDHAPLQVLARARAQEIDRVAAPVFLIGEDFAVGRIRLHVVKRGHRRGGVAKGGMTGDVVDALATDNDDAAVAQRF